MGYVRAATHPAADVNAEASARLSVLLARHGVEAEVVKGERGMIVGAAFKGDLEFAPHVLVELVAYEIAEERLRVRIDVEDFGVRDAGAVTGGDVAHGVSAGFARRDADFGKGAKQGRRFFQLQVIKLHVLA